MNPEVSVILPCRNEEKTVGKCIDKIEKTFVRHRLKGEIIISDSSTDSSLKIAGKYKAHLVKHDKKGYGIACMEGIKAAKGRYVIIGDADGTYDFSEIPLFMQKLRQNDLVIGSRLKGNIKEGAMPFMHRHFGNPFLSSLLNLFFKTRVSDAHSGFRAISKAALKKLDLRTTGMEFASEMIIKSAKSRLKISEVPITYYPRIGESKLKSFSDGWRHLRFMLMFSPTYLFLIPGFFLFFSGLLLMAMMLLGNFVVQGRNISSYLSIAGSLLAILGYQTINLGLYSRIYAIHTGFEKEDKLIDFIAEKMPLEKGILAGSIILIAGMLSFALASARLASEKGIVLTSPGILFGLTFLIIGIQTIFSVFFISMMVVEKIGN